MNGCLNFMALISCFYVLVYLHTDLFKNRHTEHCQNKIEIVEKKN